MTTKTTQLRRFLCWLGMHEWFEGGLAQSDDHRRCIYCPKRQRGLFNLWVDA